MARNKISKTKRSNVFIKYGFKCSDCDATGLLEIHHKKPVIKGGCNSLNNLVLLCRVCHTVRHGGKPKKLISSPFWIAMRQQDNRKFFLEN